MPWLRRIAVVLHYRTPTEKMLAGPPSSESVAEAMEQLRSAFQPDFKRQPAQRTLHNALSRAWDKFGSDLLHCYDIEGLPPDNLALEALFSALRRHQRRIHYQLLFQAESEPALLAQLRTVPLARYRHHRQLLEQAAEPRRFIHRLHRNREDAIQSLADATSNAAANCPT